MFANVVEQLSLVGLRRLSQWPVLPLEAVAAYFPTWPEDFVHEVVECFESLLVWDVAPDRQSLQWRGKAEGMGGSASSCSLRRCTCIWLLILVYWVMGSTAFEDPLCFLVR